MYKILGIIIISLFIISIIYMIKQGETTNDLVTSEDLKYLDIDEAGNFIKYKLSNRGFEIFTAELFRALGHRAIVTQAQFDEGRDVILDDGEIIVECKQYNKSVVGRDICIKLLGAMVYHKAKKCIVINTGEYYKNAYKVAEKTEEIELWDMLKIKEVLYKLGPKKTTEIIYEALRKQNLEAEGTKYYYRNYKN